MSKKNKAADLNVAGYMQNVRTNVRPADDDVKTVEESNSVEEENQQVEDSQHEEVVKENTIQEKEEPAVRRGRPRKSKAIVRTNQKIIKFDEAMCAEIAMVRALHKVSMQDIVYIATSRFMKEYFPKGKATKEGLEVLSEELKVLYGKED